MTGAVLTAELPVIEVSEPSSYEAAGFLMNNYRILRNSLRRKRVDLRHLGDFRESLVRSRTALRNLSSRLDFVGGLVLTYVDRTTSRTERTLGLSEEEIAESLLTSLDSQMSVIHAALHTNREYNRARKGYLN